VAGRSACDRAGAVAQKLQAEKKHEQAYAAFKAVITQFANTSAAETAQAEMKHYEKDPNFLKRANTASLQRQAESMLNMAVSYKAAGRYDLARQQFHAVIEQFPNTTFAETAKRELADLPKQ
jgi:TolA-binding protein